MSCVRLTGVTALLVITASVSAQSPPPATAESRDGESLSTDANERAMAIPDRTERALRPSGARAAQDRPREGYASTRDGVRLFYSVRGTGKDTVIVLSHLYFSQRWASLGDDHVVVFYDPRSRGRSETVSDSTKLGFNLEVEDIDRVREHIGASRFALVGFSYLGGVVARYAMLHPERVTRLALIGAIPPRDAASGQYPQAPTIRVPDVAAAREAAAMLRDASAEKDPVRYCRTYWRSVLHNYVGDPQFDEAALDALNCQVVNEQPPDLLRRFALIFRDIQKYDWREEARRISAPTLVIVGENDRAAPPAGSREWATVIPQSRVLEFSRTGHTIFLERSSELLDALRTFLAGRWPAGAR